MTRNAALVCLIGVSLAIVGITLGQDPSNGTKPQEVKTVYFTSMASLRGLLRDRLYDPGVNDLIMPVNADYYHCSVVETGLTADKLTAIPQSIETVFYMWNLVGREPYLLTGGYNPTASAIPVEILINRDKKQSLILKGRIYDCQHTAQQFNPWPPSDYPEKLIVVDDTAAIAAAVADYNSVHPDDPLKLAIEPILARGRNDGGNFKWDLHTVLTTSKHLNFVP